MKHTLAILCRPHFCMATLIGFSLAGCASADGRYPSLAVRDAERVQGSFEPAPTDQNAATGTINPETLDAPFKRASDAHARFTAMQPEVRALVSASRGLSRENDRRARALVGFATLTSLRSQTALALSDLDLLEVNAATGFERTREIRDFQNAVLRMITQQDAALDSLNEAMKQ